MDDVRRKNVILEIKDQIAYVTLNRPEKHNAIDLDMLTTLMKTARHLRKRKDIRAVVLSGNGPSFCSGLDFPSVFKKPLRILKHFFRRPFRLTNDFQDFAWAVRQIRVPVIAAIHGSCYGGGLQLALAADIRFAAADADLSVFEIKWGIIPDMSGTLTLRDLLRADIAKDLVLSGRLVSGAEGAQIGLVTSVAADPRREAHAYARRIAQLSPDAVIAAKKILNKNRHGSVAVGLWRERMYQAWLLLTPNYRRALKAGLSKTTAEFKDPLF